MVSTLDKNDKHQKEVLSHIYKSRGINEEEKIVNKHQKQTKHKVVHRNNILYKLTVGNVTLMGRCDGIQEIDGKKVIVEVKNRMKQFFNPIYEKVQIHAYMAMTEINDCVVIQHLHGEDKTDNYSFDSEFWAEIELKLINYYEYFNNRRRGFYWITFVRQIIAIRQSGNMHR